MELWWPTAVSWLHSHQLWPLCLHLAHIDWCRIWLQSYDLCCWWYWALVSKDRYSIIFLYCLYFMSLVVLKYSELSYCFQNFYGYLKSINPLNLSTLAKYSIVPFFIETHFYRICKSLWFAFMTFKPLFTIATPFVMKDFHKILGREESCPISFKSLAGLYIFLPYH